MIKAGRTIKTQNYILTDFTMLVAISNIVKRPIMYHEHRYVFVDCTQADLYLLDMRPIFEQLEKLDLSCDYFDFCYKVGE